MSDGTIRAFIESFDPGARWVLKQVQHDEVRREVHKLKRDCRAGHLPALAMPPPIRLACP
jgi:hypothetical protein